MKKAVSQYALIKKCHFAWRFLQIVVSLHKENNLSMSKEQSNIVEYLVCVIGAFAKQFSLSNAKAYQYLRQYKGLDFLTKHYGIEHTQSIEDAVEDVTIVCNRHGGALVL